MPVLNRISNFSLSSLEVKYTNPPIVETVLSVQFDRIADFGVAQLGAYWSQLSNDWNSVVDTQAIDPVREQLEQEGAWEPSALSFKLSQQIDARLQIRNASKDRMIQVQNGRFFYNWLGDSQKYYPSYEAVKPEFDEQWLRFREMVLNKTSDAVVRPNMWEVMYVNHMPQGTVWNDLSDLPDVFSFLNQPPLKESELVPRAIGGEWQFEIAPQKGKLYVKLGMSRVENNTPNLVMTILARGPIRENIPSIDEGFELGHATVLSAFDKLTTPSAQKFWGIENDNS